MVSITIPSEYGYVLGAAILNAIHVFSIGLKVSSARKAADVPYPYEDELVYAEKSEAEKDEKKNIFNCTQRAHQNTLELFPTFSILLLIGGIQYPEISAASGIVYFLGRVVYVSNYSSGIPIKRTRGVFGFLGFFTLAVTASLSVYNLVKN